jgi:hypothetical protein
MFLLPLIAVLLLFGIVTGTSWFAVGASAMLVVFQGARFFSERWSNGLEVERSVSASEVEIGDRVHVGLKVANRSHMLIPWILLEDALPKRATTQPNRGLEIVGSNAKLYFFASEQRGLMAYDLVAHRRGYYRLGPTLLETGDLLGLHRQHRIVSQTDYLLVLPKLIPLVGIDVTSWRALGDLRVSDRAMEDPSQMAGVREYRAGDPLNRVHWKATARTGVLHTRVFEPTCMQGAMIVLDMHRDSNPERNEPLRTDLAVTAAASIAHTLYQMNQPIGLISNGRDAADRFTFQEKPGEFSNREAMRDSVQRERANARLRPILVESGSGAEIFAEIHRTLARVERSDGLSLSDLLMETRSRMPRQLSVLVILQSVDDQTALSLAMLRKQGFSVSVVLNQHTMDGALDTAAKLVGQRLPVYSLQDEASIPSVCQNMLLMR